MKKIRKIAIAVLTFALIISGVIYVGKKAEEVKAATALTPSEDGSYGTLSKADALNTVNTEDDLEGNDIPNYEGYLFAGWFASEEGECTLDTAVATADEATHAKFVKEDTLSVKLQIANEAVTETTDDSTINADSAIRFISSVDSLAYRKIGFVLSYDGMEDPEDPPYYEASDVFERIDSKVYDASNNKVTYEYSPKIVGTKSEYFFTAKWAVPAASKNVDYTVQAYWITLDGTTVYGQSRCVSVADKSDSIINMTLDGELTEGLYDGTVAITSNRTSTNQVVNTSAKSVYVTDVGEGYSNVRITLPDGVTVSQFASATTITVGSASGIFRNHNTAYAGTEATIDTSWYDEYPTTETEFVISGSADLYGMSKLALRYTDNAIYVCSDITVNTGVLNPSEYENEDSWNTATQNFLGWTPFSTFAGKFDGQGHTISGIYLKTGTPSSGLFAQTLATSNVKDFKLLNSYFEFEVLASASNRNAFFGSIAGGGGGAFESIYSEATIVSDGNHNGGIVGGMNHNGSISNCQFSGSIDLGTNEGQYAGGILGCYRSSAQVNMINCLNTGALTGTHSSLIGLGGLCAYGWAGHLNMEDSMTVGTYTGSGGRIASVIARLGSGGTNATAEFTNVYYDSEKCATILTENKTDGAIIYSGTPVGKTSGELTGTNSWYNTALEFGKYWSAISSGTPQLTSFAEGTILDTLDGRGTEASPWMITTGEELKTLANYAETTYDFEEKYIKLGNDITVVNGTDLEEVKANATENWKPIGTSSNPFAGKFDGDYNTIQGLYYKGTGTYIGLFGATATGSVIENVEIANSYFEYNGDWVDVNLGSIAGQGNGTFSKIKSKAYIVSSGKNNGGIIGRKDDSGIITDCWFDGTLALGDYGINGGGILGFVGEASANITMKHCLNSGILSGGTAKGALGLGGLCGYLYNGTLTVEDSLSVGSITSTQTWRGSIIGRMSQSDSLNPTAVISNTYYNKEDGCQHGVRRNTAYGTCAVLPVGLTLSQLTGASVKESGNAENLSFTDKGDGIHWVTTDSTPILSCFAD